MAESNRGFESDPEDLPWEDAREGVGAEACQGGVRVGEVSWRTGPRADVDDERRATVIRYMLL